MNMPQNFLSRNLFLVSFFLPAHSIKFSSLLFSGSLQDAPQNLPAVIAGAWVWVAAVRGMAGFRNWEEVIEGKEKSDVMLF